MTRAAFRLSVLTALFFFFYSILSAQDKGGPSPSPGPAIGPGVVPITTRSAEARDLYLHALIKMENLHGEDAIQGLRKAVALDPDFALANIIIAFPAVDPVVDPAEQTATRNRAIAAKAKVSRGEQLIIEWLASSSEGHMVSAIQAMNEALDEYPNDKHLAWMAGVWVENQQQWTRAIPIFERAIQLDPEFAAPLNEVAYCYARSNLYDKAFHAMQRYISLLPNEANPQDSFAEILRMGGKFDDALIHYRAALKIDPGFIESQFGIADTYALMGDESRARAEYAVAIQGARTKSEGANWSLNAAITYVREGDLRGADQAFRAVATQAHRDDLGLPEAEAYRMMAMYQTDSKAAVQLLERAEQVLKEGHPVSSAAREEELALLLRERAARAAQNGKVPLADSYIRRLQQMAERSQDQSIQLAYDGAAGAVLVATGKYEEALPRLEQDDHNPLSVKSMLDVYRALGNKLLAEETRKRLANWNDPTLEQALVVPEFREKPAATASSFRRM